MDFLIMEQTIESILIYSSAILLCLFVVLIYLRKKNRASRVAEEKVRKAKEEGLHEPISLHPYIDVAKCIQTGACISACPEKDILGIIDGKATLINASQCIGHGACFQACPTGAISLRIGTEKRGVDLPDIDPHFETNVPGIYIAGEGGEALGGLAGHVEPQGPGRGRRPALARDLLFDWEIHFFCRPLDHYFFTGLARDTDRRSRLIMAWSTPRS